MACQDAHVGSATFTRSFLFADQMKKETNPYRQVIFYDGVCLLCNRFILFVLKADRKEKIFISALQSEFTKTVLEDYNLSHDAMESVVFLKDGIIYTESSAALKIFQLLGFPWAIMAVFFIIPKIIRNGIYRWIARNRYKWFGKSEAVCEIPEPRFLMRVIE